MSATKIHKDGLPPEARIRGAVHNLQKAEGTFDHLTFHAETEIPSTLGVALKHDVVISVKRGSVLQGIVRPGDILESLNEFKLTEDKHLNNDTISRIMKPEKKISHLIPYLSKELKLVVTVLRLRSKCSEKVVLPAKFTPRKFHAYEYVQLFWIRGMELGLELKEIDNMCFVVGLFAGGIANLGLSIGDRIIDVNGKLIETAEEAKTQMLESFNAKGYVRVCIEVPCSDIVKNQLRPKIQASTSVDVVPPELLEYAARGIQTLRNVKPGKTILRESNSNHKEPANHKSPLQRIQNKKKKKVSFTDKSTEFSHFVDNKSRLFVAVPLAKTLKSEAARNVKKKVKNNDDNTDITGEEKTKGKMKKTDNTTTTEEESVPKKKKSADKLSADKTVTEKTEGSRKTHDHPKTPKERKDNSRKKDKNLDTAEEKSILQNKKPAEKTFHKSKWEKLKKGSNESTEKTSEESKSKMETPKKKEKQDKQLLTAEEKSVQHRKKPTEKTHDKPRKEKSKDCKGSSESTEKTAEDGIPKKETPKKREKREKQLETAEEQSAILNITILSKKSPVEPPPPASPSDNTNKSVDVTEEDPPVDKDTFETPKTVRDNPEFESELKSSEGSASSSAESTIESKKCSNE